MAVRSSGVLDIVPTSSSLRDLPRTSGMVSTRKLFLVPNIVSSRIRFHRPKLARGTSVCARDYTTTTNNIASCVSVPGIMPRAASLRALRRGFSLNTGGDLIGCSFFFKTARAGARLLRRLSMGGVYNMGLFVNDDANGVLMSQRSTLHAVFAQDSLPVVARYRSSTVVTRGLGGDREVCNRSPTIIRRPRVHDRRTYFHSARLTMTLTHRAKTHLRITRIDATHRLSLFRDAPLCGAAAGYISGHVATRTYVTRLCCASTSCRQLKAHVGYGPTVGASASHRTLHGTLGSKHVSIVNASRTPRLLRRGRNNYIGTISNVPVMRFSLVTVLGLTSRKVLGLRHIIRLVYRTPTQLFSVRKENFVHRKTRTSLMLLHPASPQALLHGSVLDGYK